METERAKRLADFVSWVGANIKGDEKGEAQVFLDRFNATTFADKWRRFCPAERSDLPELDLIPICKLNARGPLPLSGLGSLSTQIQTRVSRLQFLSFRVQLHAIVWKGIQRESLVCCA